jgi:hypothetical protein
VERAAEHSAQIELVITSTQTAVLHSIHTATNSGFTRNPKFPYAQPSYPRSAIHLSTIMTLASKRRRPVARRSSRPPSPPRVASVFAKRWFKQFRSGGGKCPLSLDYSLSIALVVFATTGRGRFCCTVFLRRWGFPQAWARCRCSGSVVATVELHLQLRL